MLVRWLTTGRGVGIFRPRHGGFPTHFIIPADVAEEKRSSRSPTEFVMARYNPRAGDGVGALDNVAGTLLAARRQLHVAILYFCVLFLSAESPSWPACKKERQLAPPLSGSSSQMLLCSVLG
jgi:hypothetical protein